MRELLERALPHDPELEKLVLCGLIVGHGQRQAKQALKVLDLDDFYLGSGELHGWLFSQIRWAQRKQTQPLSEIYSRFDKSNWCRLGYDLALIIQARGRVKQLAKYVECLQEVREWRDKILAAEEAYKDAWATFDDMGL